MQQTKNITFILLLAPALAFGQLVVDDGISANDAVLEILAGDGVTIENIQFSGDGNQLGYFNSELSNIGLETGIVLSTGSVQGSIGPNTTSSHTSSGGNIGASDPDLEILVGAETNDASILEFDFVPTGDSLVFRYVFASEEYNEYACSDFNDAFGFFVSGPGLNGPFSNNAVNIAVVPNSDIPVSINSINNGQVGVFGEEEFCSNLDPNWQDNTQYFVNNEPAADANSTQYDGLTTVLTATALVSCGETYHIKLAIADAFDDNLDSAVFLEAESLDSQGYHTSLAVDPTLQNVPENTLVEGCSEMNISITRPDATLEEYLALTVSGSAAEETDYSTIPDVLVFAPGENTVSFPVAAVLDEEMESTEEVMILFAYQNSCGNAVSQTISFEILDYQPLEILNDEYLQMCDESTQVLTAEVTGGLLPFVYLWDSENGEVDYSISSDDEFVQLAVVDACQNTADILINVEESEPLEVEFESVGCIGTPYNPLLMGGVEPIEITWSGPSDIFVDQEFISFSEPGNYEITWTDACASTALIETEISTCTLFIPNVFTPNGDAQNDYLRIDGLEHFPGTEVRIFDRWGTQIFGSPDYRNNWDAHGVGEGTYFLSLVTAAGEEHSSHLTILR